MPKEDFESLADVQRLVNDITKVERNHTIPGTDRHENVVEHSFASAMLAWWVHDKLELDLDMAKVFKYIMVHDFTERGLSRDYNAYRHASDHASKEEYEQAQLESLVEEFEGFAGFVEVLTGFQQRVDDEAWFAETIEKMQAIVLDQIDDWRAHRAIDARYDDYIAHHEGVLERAYPPAHFLLDQVIEYGRQTYWDQPKPPEV